MGVLDELKKAAVVCAMAAAVCGASAASAEGADSGRMLDLAKARNCLACHGVERKVLGPSFKEVAQKYADNSLVADKMASKILRGGYGAWGMVPMPANPQVSEAESTQLAEWILRMK